MQRKCGRLAALAAPAGEPQGLADALQGPPSRLEKLRRRILCAAEARVARQCLDGIKCHFFLVISGEEHRIFSSFFFVMGPCDHAPTSATVAPSLAKRGPHLGGRVFLCRGRRLLARSALDPFESLCAMATRKKEDAAQRVRHHISKRNAEKMTTHRKKTQPPPPRERDQEARKSILFFFSIATEHEEPPNQ